MKLKKFSCLDQPFPVHLFYQLYIQETDNLNITGKQEFFSALAFNKVHFRQKKVMCSQNFVLIWKGFDQKTVFFTGFDIKKVSPLARLFLCLTLQKTFFRSLFFHI